MPIIQILPLAFITIMPCRSTFAMILALMVIISSTWMGIHAPWIKFHIMSMAGIMLHMILLVIVRGKRPFIVWRAMLMLIGPRWGMRMWGLVRGARLLTSGCVVILHMLSLRRLCMCVGVRGGVGIVW